VLPPGEFNSIILEPLPFSCESLTATQDCLSVCLTHADIVSKRLTYPQTFSPSGSHAIVVYLYQTVLQYSDGAPPPLAGRRIQGGMKNRDFRSVSRFISEMTRDRAIVTTKRKWETEPKLWYHFESP